MDVRLPDRARRAYDAQRLLASGPQGRVVLARHRESGRLVAVKIADVGPRDRARERIRREAELTARVKHAHAAEVLEHDADDSWPWLAREYLPGPTLAAHVPRAGLPWQRACAIAAQLAEALDAVHRAGLLHRDVKAANVIQAANGLWKLTDFDVACARDGENEIAVAGTPGWLAPELLVGKPATERSDVFGLGIALHLMLTAALPFEGGDPFERMTRSLEEDAAPLAKLRPGLPEELGAVLAAAIHRDPVKRTASMRALADQLWRLVLGETAGRHAKRSQRLVWGRAPVPSRPATRALRVPGPAAPPPEARPQAPRRRAMSMMAAVVLLAGTLFLAGRTAIGEKPENEPFRIVREAAARSIALATGQAVSAEAVRRTVR